MSSPNNISFESMNTSNNMSMDIPDDIPLVTSVSKSRFTLWFVFKMVLGIVIFTLLALNIFTYAKTGKDAFTYFFNSSDNENTIPKKKSSLEKNNTADNIYDSIDLSAKDVSEKEEKMQTDLHKEVETIEKKDKITKDKSKSDFFDNNDEDTIVDKIKNVSNNSNALVNKDNVDMEDKYADEENQSHYKASSVLDLKLTKTPGYCYVGTEQNYRTCVKVGAGDTCMSGQVFPTENLCINPNLKE